ncbi:hypothetical protein [Goodfellowiella coeruleoviolacea]|uniref:Uncharacterized protein n=1 Tax=Goodfellowiella coeruleoviolacea TaxID=334858 RepID=A0AAE3GKX2_9PSEU|nr:hypothetical protein [Goodfellowiella coeruleoviolacea]MCP2169274.1 hypothetical protein [Goodfellowiella coeruleoviolacea]
MTGNDHVWWHVPGDNQSHAFRTEDTLDPNRTVYHAAGECETVVSASEVVRETTKTPCTPCLLATMIANLPAPKVLPQVAHISDAELRQRCPLLAHRLSGFCARLASVTTPPTLAEMRDLARSLVLLGGSLYDRAEAGIPIRPAPKPAPDLADPLPPHDRDHDEPQD